MNSEHVLDKVGKVRNITINSGWSELKYLWYSDLYRYTGKTSKWLYIHALLRNSGYQYTFFMRLCSYLALNKKNIARRTLLRFFYEVLRHYEIKYGISIPYNTRIGSGLYIGHFGGIVVNSEAVIGKNCNIHHGVTIGQANRGDKKGYPVIGDRVFIGPGAAIIGKVKVGNDVAIGASTVVTKDIPDNAVAVGVPARVISFDGSKDYINRTDY
jgi:serine O-acetyltransferase